MPDIDRSKEDVGNIIQLGHVNVFIPDQRLATMFYVTGLGLTRDPFLVTGDENMWINVGYSQFHLPSGDPQVLRGHVGLVIPDREGLLAQLASVKESLRETKFAFSEHEDYIEAISPWGNVLHIYEPAAQFEPITLGIPYVQFDVSVDSTAAIARFYQDVIGATSEVCKDEDGPYARCSIGYRQELIFRETDQPIPAYDGHHIQVYAANYSSPYRKLKDRGLITADGARFVYRFQDITDDETGKVVFTIDHEIRPLSHPLYGQPLTNRDPSRSNRHFAPGQEERSWSIAY